MQLHTLEAKARTTGSKGLNTQARINGTIPSVLYGLEAQNLPIMVERRSLEKILHTEGGQHALIQLEFADAPDNNTPAIVKSVQHHPVSDAVLHVDFLRISLDRLIQSPVSVVLVGRAKGVIDGGIIDQQIREVIVECLALDIPKNIEVNVTEMAMGDTIHVSDLNVADGVTILTDPELAVASVQALRVAKTTDEATEGAGEEAKEASEGAEG